MNEIDLLRRIRQDIYEPRDFVAAGLCMTHEFLVNDLVYRLANFITVDLDGHWMWNGCLSSMRYARLNLHRRDILVHRLMYELCRGQIPDGMVIRHRCNGTPTACVNPDHIETGTQLENMRDILEDTGKLSAQKVTLLTADRIRRDYRSGAVSMRDLAVSYGVGASTISRVIRSATP